MVNLTRIPFRKIKHISIPAILFVIFFIIYVNIPIYNDNDSEIIPSKIIDNYSATVIKNLNIDKFNFQSYFNASNQSVNYNVHIFYYAWYGNLKVDKRWIHWNHKRLPHWNNILVKDFSQGQHKPPEDIGSDFYPALGLYSSRNETIIEQHFKMIKFAGVGVIVLSWFPKNKSDSNGHQVDDLVNLILDKADKLHLKVALHLEPYPDRSIFSIKEDLSYIQSNYANHSAFFKKPRHKKLKPLPVVFIYDSYLISSNDWNRIFGDNLRQSIRNKPIDFFVVGLLLDVDGYKELSNGKFDAGYTYFAGDQVSYSSAARHWKDINRKCSLKNIEFYPSIGPGYKDSAIRPWNSFVTRDRNNGEYYIDRFEKMIASEARSFGITSFNEWHEGTQIEPALPHNSPSWRSIYDDYLPKSPIYYLEMTRKFVDSFTKNKA